MRACLDSYAEQVCARVFWRHVGLYAGVLRVTVVGETLFFNAGVVDFVASSLLGEQLS